MAYGRTSRGAHDLWANTVKDSAYTYDNMVKFYERTMNFSPPDSRDRGMNATPLYRPTDTVKGGGLDVTYPSYAQAWSTWVAKGLGAIGLKPANSFIDGNLMGHSWQMTTIKQKTGTRSSSATGYLGPIIGRRNLVIMNGTMAERIIFNNKKEATGVSVTSRGKTFTVQAKKEVILSAGVMQSPQLLMASGVGPQAQLRKFNIPVIADRPGVGQNFIDHITVPISYQVNVETTSTLTDGRLLQAVNQWNTHGIGPLSNPGGDYIGMEKAPQEFRAKFSPQTKKGKSFVVFLFPDTKLDLCLFV
jgi:choline dehydrogenase